MAEQPKGGFYIAVGLVVACADWLCDLSQPDCDRSQTGAAAGRRTAAQAKSTPRMSRNRPNRARIRRARRPSRNTTSSPPRSCRRSRARPPTSRSTNNTVRFALNVWAGWAPIVLANNGFKAGKEWTAPATARSSRSSWCLIDNPVAMRDAYAAGDVHIGWATLDMVPLVPRRVSSTRRATRRDSRIMPRIYQQVDFSNGGDGIVVRENIKTAADLRGKKMVLAQNSPSHYFALNMLVSGGVQPPEVQMIFTERRLPGRGRASMSQKDISGCVSWAPDIYNLSKIKGNRMLVTTQDANRLIADVWFARADFARDHGPIIEGLVRGIFDAMDKLKEQDAKKKVSELMAAGYNIPAVRCAFDAGRRPQHQLGRELPVLHQ